MIGGETVTVWREVRNEFGDDVVVTEERTLSGCAVAPRSVPGSSPETDGARNIVVAGRTLYAPPHSGLTAHHQVRLRDGSVWRVEGEVGAWRSPFSGWYPGDQAELERVTG